MMREEDHLVTFETLALLTGFPVDFIKRELFLGKLPETKELSLDQLRSNMIKYLDRKAQDFTP